jgi:hypothetical protein
MIFIITPSAQHENHELLNYQQIIQMMHDQWEALEDDDDGAEAASIVC